ncbi:MAG: cytochrome c-type biogenesis protein, partial [Acidimicrobiia bacterium]
PDEDRVERIAHLVRCPQCLGQSIAESPAPIARDMLRTVEERVAAGWSDRQIIDAFRASFTDVILLDPPARGANLLLWLVPGLAVGVGVMMMLGRRRSPPPLPAPPAPSLPPPAGEPGVPERAGTVFRLPGRRHE